MQTPPAPRESILEQLERMLASDTFAGAERSRLLLKFLVEHALENQSDRLKEYTIGSEALGRGDSFDPRTDPIVRAEASRLRNRLQQYYATHGAADTVFITLPKGSYVPQLQIRDNPGAAPVAGTAGDRPSAPGRFQRLIWFAMGGITVGAAVMLVVWTRGREAPTTEFGEVDVQLGATDRSLGSDFGTDVILSPDGTRIVFVARGSDQVLRLMTMIVGSPRKVAPLPDTDGARAPFFSPDGQWVGFWADAKLKKVSVHGGSPSELTDAIAFAGGSWGEDGNIIAAIDGALTRVSTTGEQEVVADLKKERVVPQWPDLLPGGSHVLFTAVGPAGPDAASIEMLSLSDGRRTTLIRAGTFGRYLDEGCLLYVNQGTLFAVPFDRQQSTVEGPGVPVLEDRVAYSTVFGNAQLAISQEGTLIYRRSPASGNLVAWWLDRGGGVEPLMNKPGAYTFPRLSLDGQRLAINVTDSGVPRTEIYDRQLERTTRLPFAPGSMSPVWHPGGFLVLGSRTGMSWMKADDMSKLETLTPTPSVQIPSSFTTDGTRLAYAEASPSLDLWTIPVSHSGGKLIAGKPEPFLRTPYYESHPSFSPDGEWLAYGSGQYGIWDVYVRPFPLDDSKEIKISEGGGRIARWMPNGRELVYRTDDHRLMVVGYQVKNGTFIAGKPKEWTPVRLGDTGVVTNFDVHGDRVLGLVAAARDEAERIRNQVTVIPRFSEEVRRRLSAHGK
jgi:serine/threonine-protein kinase